MGCIGMFSPDLHTGGFRCPSRSLQQRDSGRTRGCLLPPPGQTRPARQPRCLAHPHRVLSHCSQRKYCGRTTHVRLTDRTARSRGKRRAIVLNSRWGNAVSISPKPHVHFPMHGLYKNGGGFATLTVADHLQSTARFDVSIMSYDGHHEYPAAKRSAGTLSIAQRHALSAARGTTGLSALAPYGRAGPGHHAGRSGRGKRPLRADPRGQPALCPLRGDTGMLHRPHRSREQVCLRGS